MKFDFYSFKNKMVITEIKLFCVVHSNIKITKKTDIIFNIISIRGSNFYYEKSHVGRG